MRRLLTPWLVSQIRLAKLSDAEWERRLKVPARTIREARIGGSWPRVTTPPDIRRGEKAATRRSYFRE